MVAAIDEQERLILYVEQPGAAFQEAVDNLALRLKLHRSGFEIREIEAIPRLANGKVDYRSLARGIAVATGR
jgi:hypothetical protein